MKRYWTDFIPFYGLKYFNRYFKLQHTPTNKEIIQANYMFSYNIIVMMLIGIFALKLFLLYF